MSATEIESSNAPGAKKPSGAFLSDETDRPIFSPWMEEDIDRRLAIAREQIKNGQYNPLDEASTKEFLDKAYARSKKLLDSKG